MTKTIVRPKFYRIFMKFFVCFLAVGVIIGFLLTVHLSARHNEMVKNYSYLRNELYEVLCDEDLKDCRTKNAVKYYASSFPLCVGRDVRILIDDELVSSTDAFMTYKSDGLWNDDTRIYCCSDSAVISEALNSVYSEDFKICNSSSVFTGTLFEFLTLENYLDHDYATEYEFAIFTDDESGEFKIDLDKKGTAVGNIEVISEGIFSDDFMVEQTDDFMFTDKEGNNHICRLEYSPNIHMRNVYSNTGMAFVFIYSFIIFAVLFCSVVVSLIVYFNKKQIYEIYAYKMNLTNILAHNLKTPLMAISSYAENYQISSSEDKKSYYISKIQENISSINTLVTNTLKLSRAENSNGKISKELTDVSLIVKELLDQMSDGISARNLIIDISNLQSNSVFMNRLIFKNSVSCILENAIKYAPKNSDIKISSGEKILVVSNEYEGDIEVPEKLKEPYVRGSSVRADSDGTGLGLAIADCELNSLDFKLDISTCNNTFLVVISHK